MDMLPLLIEPEKAGSVVHDCPQIGIDLMKAHMRHGQPRSLISVLIARYSLRDAQELVGACKPIAENSSTIVTSKHREYAQNLEGVHVNASHKGCTITIKLKTFADFKFKTPSQWMVEWRPEAGPVRRVSIFDYYHLKHNGALQHPQLPPIEMEDGMVFPIELLQTVGISTPET